MPHYASVSCARATRELPTCTRFVITASSAWHPRAIAQYCRPAQLSSAHSGSSLGACVEDRAWRHSRSCGSAADARTEGQTHEGCHYRRDESRPPRGAQACSRAAARCGRDLRGRRHGRHLQRQLDRLLRLERCRRFQPRAGLEHDQGRCVARASPPQRLGPRLGLEATSERALALNWPPQEAAPGMAAAAPERHLLLLVGPRRT
jgi:hypothetical protein